MQKVFNVTIVLILAMSIYSHWRQSAKIKKLESMNTKIVSGMISNARDTSSLQNTIVDVINAINDGAVYIDYEIE